MIKLNALERIHYFEGRLLSAEDLQQEQDYFRAQHRRHNQLLHGAGIVYGLNVSADSNNLRSVQVEPGVALDCYGNEICITEPVQLQVPSTRKLMYLCLKYCEQDIDLIPIPSEPSTLDNPTQPSRIRESFELTFETSNPFVDHKRHGSVWVACGDAHCIPLARFRFSRKLLLDRRFASLRTR
jgi:hypothetical protein